MLTSSVLPLRVQRTRNVHKLPLLFLLSSTPLHPPLYRSGAVRELPQISLVRTPRKRTDATSLVRAFGSFLSSPPDKGGGSSIRRHCYAGPNPRMGITCSSGYFLS